ncbi:hypothetical protein ACFFRR_009713 [Megaselia abdita]
MASQPRKSALLLSRDIRNKPSFRKLTFQHSIILLVSIIDLNLVQSATIVDVIASANLVTSNLKFGDRLSPRSKQSINLNDSVNSSNENSITSYKLIDFELNNIKNEGNENKKKKHNFSQAEIKEIETKHERNDDTNFLDTLGISKADRFEMSTEFFVIPTQSDLYVTNDLTHGNGILSKSGLIMAPKISINTTSTTVSSLNIPSHPSVISSNLTIGLRKEPWVIPILVLALLTMIMMVGFEFFVLFKAWRTSPSRRHLFLGQMLLLGLFVSSGFGALITSNPTALSCGILRFGIGVSYALVFAALLVKCVFLISLNSGVYLPASYQGLLLLFAVLIQVAIGAQWLMTQPPEIQMLTVPVNGHHLFSQNSHYHNITGKFSMLITSSDLNRLHPVTEQHTISTVTTTIPLCKTQFTELLLSLIYIVFLIMFVAILAIKSRGIRDNYREATYIGLAVGGAIPICLGWTFCGLAVADRHKDACIGFGLVATSATIFLVMFMPKGRQLAAMGKEGLYIEDREDRFSSLSRAGSGYSPSFFHFKPIKYGVIGQVTNSNAGNEVISKHHISAASATSNNGNGPGAHFTHPFCFYPQPLPPPLPPPTYKGIGNSITSMSPVHLAHTFRYPGLFLRSDDANVYTTLEPTLSSNPNVYFQRSGGVHPGMMY